MKAFYFIFLVFLVRLSLNAQGPYFPPVNNQEWETKSLADLGWCQEPVDQLLELLEQNGTKAFILLKDGKIVIESYFDNHAQESYWYWASAGKTLVAFLTGMAQEKGFLAITDTTSNIIGQGWTSCLPSQEEGITVWHQLTMTSGLDDGVADNHCTDPNCLVFKANAGTRWAYHNAPYTLLESVLGSSTGISLNQMVNSWLKNYTGINGLFVKQGYNNVFFSNARSMARFGLLVLNNGNWNGVDLLADQNYFHQMVSTSQSINKSYGYLWWLNGKESYMLPGLQFPISGSLFPDAPSDLVVAAGKDGQFINVVPSQNLVWIRMGNPPDNLLLPFLHNNQIWQHINNLSCPSNIEETNRPLLSETSIFPNPASGYIVVAPQRPTKRIEILDAFGKVVDIIHTRENFDPELIQISLNDLSRGIYLLRIFYLDGEVNTKKVIKN